MKSAIIALILPAAAALAGQAQPPEATTPDPAEAILQAADSVAAGDLYRTAASDDPGNVRLHGAYMERMMRAGWWDDAYRAARMLVFLDERNGTAWGVVAYGRARNGEFRSALEAAARAVQLLPNDAFVLRLTGQLAAWYEDSPQAEAISPATVAALHDLWPALLERPAFVEGFEGLANAKLARVSGKAPPGGSPESPAAPAAPQPVAKAQASPKPAQPAGLAQAAFPPLEADDFLTAPASPPSTPPAAEVHASPPPAEPAAQGADENFPFMDEEDVAAYIQMKSRPEPIPPWYVREYPRNYTPRYAQAVYYKAPSWGYYSTAQFVRPLRIPLLRYKMMLYKAPIR